MPLPVGVMSNVKHSIVERLAALIKQVDERPLTAEEEQAARLCLLDALGVGLYGSTQPEAKMFLKAVKRLGSGEVPVWGTNERLEAGSAALVCGSLCHLRELDDVHYAILHTGCVCVPAVMAAAQLENASLGQMLRAVVNGVEATARISLGMDYMEHRERGWHGTATCGAFGAAAAVGYLLGLDEKQLTDAVSIAGSRTGGTWAFSKDGAMTKRLHPGLAARDGLSAAYLAKAGVSGPHYVLEAEDGGFYRLFSPSWDEESVLSPRERLEVNNIEFKWFASCKSVHSPITAAMEIYQANPQRKPEDVSHITAEVNSSAMSMAGHMYREDSVVSAQISIPYGIALGLTGRQGQADDYAFERLADKQLRSLSEKTEVVVTEEFNELRRAKHLSGSRVTVYWKDGTASSAVATSPKGSLGNPLRPDDVMNKFLSLSGKAIGSERAETLLAVIMKGGAATPVSEILKLLVA